MAVITVDYDTGSHLLMRKEIHTMLESLPLGKTKKGSDMKQQMRDLRYFPEFDVVL
jgi:hypothetical protein